MDITHVDCGTCSVRGRACGDCVVTVLLGPPAEVELTGEEQAAIDALAGAGMVPPLRLVRGVDALPQPELVDPPGPLPDRDPGHGWRQHG
ncbi:hypothetical protein ACQBAU_06120 [Propionibacteriaceae bacterium Y2011]|uniref:hypothetical protein n=1 Tax=Microlunatus sp. Y2014 TaxID=3418488 RepID=UPI003B454343